MARKISKSKIASLLTDPRVKFNWGYHEGVLAYRNNFTLAASHDRQSVYAVAWMMGRDDAKAGKNTENSDAAWFAAKAAGLKAESAIPEYR